MPNKKQRIKNRDTAMRLSLGVPQKIICPECGIKTKNGHFVHSGDGDGFFICHKFYGEDGKRLDGV